MRSTAVRWTELHDAISERHPALVAVHRSDSGQLALLLRHALVPTSGQRRMWRHDIQCAARDVARDLRAAGLRGRLLIVQRLPPVRARRVLDRWRLLWQRDPLRASELRTMARRHAADARVLAARTERRRGGRRPGVAIEQWYGDLAPLWLGLGPEPRRRLVLQTHVWITERLAAPVVEPDDAAAYEAFRQRLERLVPPDDRDRWAGWIDTVVVTLLRAFDRPPALRDARWARSLFLAACRVAPPLPHDARLNTF